MTNEGQGNSGLPPNDRNDQKVSWRNEVVIGIFESILTRKEKVSESYSYNLIYSVEWSGEN
jgi:hypothetical protein